MSHVPDPLLCAIFQPRLVHDGFPLATVQNVDKELLNFAHASEL